MADERERELRRELARIVGQDHVLTGDSSTRRYRTGYRFGTGPVYAVVRPGSLVEQWRVVCACVAAGKTIIMQAANTGLTGGSTPDGHDYDRDIVIVNMMRLDTVHLIDEGRQVICLPGATLYQLERELKPLGREPHSVIGSSCIGASVIGGVCNNSGGSLVRRGPAFTQMALFAKVDADGQVRLVNDLGVALGNDPEEILDRLERGAFASADVACDGRLASDSEYKQHVREVDADTPARFNADPRRLHGASGSAGKLAVFAVRLDTFPKEERTQVFYIGSNDPAALGALRRHMLANFDELPVAAEYIHRDAFNIAEAYGKDTFLAIEMLGTSRLPRLFAAKAWVDELASRARFVPRAPSDRLMQAASRLFPRHLPRRMRDFRDRFEHHVLLNMSGDGIAPARAYLEQQFPTASGDYFECTPKEGAKAFLHRFAVAGAAVRYRAVHAREVEEIIALDIALRRNDEDWFEQLPDAITSGILHRLYYGHFFCHVFHQDYIVAKGHDPIALEHRMLELLDARGAEYPAEHNVGHLYAAKPALREFYAALDPCNVMNPGIGQTSKCVHWGERERTHDPLPSSGSD
jgi:D-lactate dehydrogenase